MTGLDQLAAPPVFIVGCGRSGTTWVYDILTAHPAVCGVSESFLFSRGAGVGLLYDDSHWQLSSSGDPRGLARFTSREDLSRAVGRFASDVLGSALEPHHRFLIEKTPEHGRVLGVIAEVLPEARFIHVLRDGRDVVVSIRAATRSWAPGWKDHGGASVGRSAGTWQRAVMTAREQGARLGERFTEVRYEQIKADPLESYRHLFGFCGIPYDERMLERIREETDITRRPHGEKSFYRAGRVGDWRRGFNLLHRLAFDRAAGDLLVETGYESSRRWWLPRPR